MRKIKNPFFWNQRDSARWSWWTIQGDHLLSISFSMNLWSCEFEDRVFMNLNAWLMKMIVFWGTFSITKAVYGLLIEFILCFFCSDLLWFYVNCFDWVLKMQSLLVVFEICILVLLKELVKWLILVWAWSDNVLSSFDGM